MPRQPINMPFDRHGHLTLLERMPGGWRCRCDCGNEVMRSRRNLGPDASCGLCVIRRPDITGTKLGELTAVKCVGKDKYRNALWLWSCSCGRGELVLPLYSVKKRKVKYCQMCVNTRRVKGDDPQAY